jgi:hypothetical protein
VLKRCRISAKACGEYAELFLAKFTLLLGLLQLQRSQSIRAMGIFEIVTELQRGFGHGALSVYKDVGHLTDANTNGARMPTTVGQARHQGFWKIPPWSPGLARWH